MATPTDTEPTGPTYPEVHVQLSQMDGNVFSIIGRVSGAIRKKHGAEAAKAFSEAAMDKPTYDDVLQFVMATVEIS